MFKNTSFTGVLTAVAVFALPFVVSHKLFYGATNAKYFFVVGFVAILGLIFAYRLLFNKITLSVRKRYLLWTLGVLLVLHYVSSLFGPYPSMSLWSDILRSTGVYFFTALSLMAYFLSELLRREDWILIRRSVIISCVIFSFLYFLGAEGAGFATRIFSIKLNVIGLTLGNSTFAGAYVLFGVIFTLIELGYSRGKRWLQIALVGGLLIELLSPLYFNSHLWRGVITFSDALKNPFQFFGTAQASAVTVFAILVYWGIATLIKKFSKEPRQNILLSGHALLWMIAISIGVLMLFISGSPVQDRYIAKSTAARVIVWESGWQAIKERPLLGYGPENFALAIQGHFDNRLYLEENIGETWFDRAHNFFIDTLVRIGFVGTAVYLGLLIYLGHVFLQAGKIGIIRRQEAHLLSVLIFGHILQLQTSFDTIATYTLLFLLIGYGVWLEKEQRQMQKRIEKIEPIAKLRYPKMFLGSAIILLVIVSAPSLIFAEHARQKALYYVFTEKNDAKRIEFAKDAISRVSSFESLRLSSMAFVRGLLEKIADRSATEVLIATAKEEIKIYEEAFEKRLIENPSDYRSHMDLAYLYLTSTIIGDTKTARAKELVNLGYALSPENPLTYTLDALVELYQGNIAEAEKIAARGLALNPDITMSQKVVAHIEAQAKSFPTISVLRLENL